MSGPFAIAGVTAVLKDVLNKQFSHPEFADLASAIGSFTITTIAPDRVATGEQEPNQLNLFLYQITANQGWFNTGLPSRDSDNNRVDNPPLAIDLHYLVTAYGSDNFNDEILLGCAMQAFHETPVMSRAYIRNVLDNSGGTAPAPFDVLSAVDLADQIELIKITPKFLTTEELSKLWTAMQARFRQTMAYHVSVVLIQSKQPVKAALPVLKRGEDDRGVEAFANAQSTFPILNSIHSGPSSDSTIKPLPRSFPSAQLGFQLILQGQNLDGDAVVVELRHTRFSEPGHPNFLPIKMITVLPIDRTATEIKLQLPDDATAQTEWQPGLYTVKATVTKAGKSHSTNESPLVLAPKIVNVLPANSITRVGLNATITLISSPQIILRDEATLLLAEREIKADSTAAGINPVFFIENAPVITDLPIRLRVNGVDSMPFERTTDSSSLQFADNQKVSIS